MSARVALAEAFHDGWMEWSKAIASREQISDDTVEPWRGYWIPYDDLDEDVKDRDRRQADYAIDLLFSELVER